MKRPTELISKIKHCYNGEFQDLYDYIIFLENLTKTQRTKTIDEVKILISARLIDNLNLTNATKYGNKNAKQQANSYATVMKYEIADCVDDLLEDLEQIKEQK